MPEHNRQTNAHLVGNVTESDVEAIFRRLDYNVITLATGQRGRLVWLVQHANLVIIFPGWQDSDAFLTELCVASLLKIEMRFLHELLADSD